MSADRTDIDARDVTGKYRQGISGNPNGRPKGSRNKLATEFVDALYADFQVNGADAIKRVAEKQPAKYLQLIASILPRELDIELTAKIGVFTAEIADFKAAYELALQTIGSEIEADEPIMIEHADEGD